MYQGIVPLPGVCTTIPKLPSRDAAGPLLKKLAFPTASCPLSEE